MLFFPMPASLLFVCLLCAGALVLLGAPVLFRTQRRRAQYFSGRAPLVRAAVQEEIDQGHCPGRFRALALSGTGELLAARRALLAPFHAPFDEEEELSLCVEILGEAFEGRSREALALCQRLLQAAFRPTAQSRARRQARRAGVVAIARATAGVGDEVDLAELSRTPTFEPALYWACRYSAALCCVARQEPELGLALVAKAPSWGQDSVFQVLQKRIHAAACDARQAARRAA